MCMCVLTSNVVLSALCTMDGGLATCLVNSVRRIGMVNKISLVIVLCFLWLTILDRPANYSLNVTGKMCVRTRLLLNTRENSIIKSNPQFM